MRYSENKIFTFVINNIIKMAYFRKSRKSVGGGKKSKRFSTRARRGGKLCANCKRRNTVYDDDWCVPCQTAWRRSRTNSADNPN